MIRSMTGFASVSREDEAGSVGVTLRAVNHRYLDVQIRMPQGLAAMESRVRAALQGRVARGRLELSVSVQPRHAPVPEVELNEAFVRRLWETLSHAREEGLINGTLAPGDLLRLPQALTIKEAAGADTSVNEALASQVEAAVDAAIDALNEMREREGGHLNHDLETRRAWLGEWIEQVAVAAGAGRVALERRLAERVAELGREFPGDPVAIAQEIVRVAARSDITEEVVRFKSHLSHWSALTGASEPCGRKLDFLLQEMNREVNTIGSKADGPGVPELVVNAKAELERMREQVQNVE